MKCCYPGCDLNLKYNVAYSLYFCTIFNKKLCDPIRSPSTRKFGDENSHYIQGYAGQWFYVYTDIYSIDLRRWNDYCAIYDAKTNNEVLKINSIELINFKTSLELDAYIQNLLILK